MLFPSQQHAARDGLYLYGIGGALAFPIGGGSATDRRFGASLDLGTWVAFGGPGGAVGLVQYLQPSLVHQWRASRETSFYFGLTAMAGFSKPDELRKHASAAFGPFGVGLTMGFAWTAR